jgi:RNase P/RNase MRP subunit POP5
VGLLLIRLIRKRYIAFKIVTDARISKRKINEALLRNVSLNKNGEVKPYLRVIDYDAERGLGIIRCGHNLIGQLLHSQLRIEGVSTELNIKTLGTSGSIKALKRKYLSRKYE